MPDHPQLYYQLLDELLGLNLGNEDCIQISLYINVQKVLTRPREFAAPLVSLRGDRSRTTEGSGLGLSIARSLTEIQGRKLDVIIDGDLFKVSVYMLLITKN